MVKLIGEIGRRVAGIWEIIPSGERFWSVGRVDPGVAPPVGVCAVGRRDHPDPDLVCGVCCEA